MRVKNLLKKLILLFLYSVIRGRNPDNGLMVLMYHRITDDKDYSDPLKVSRACFDKQIRFLKSNYTIISADDLEEIIQGSRPMPENACLITFDDGWKDNYDHAYPLLKKHDVPAIIFISTDFIGTDKVFWHERLQNILKRVPSNTPLNGLKVAFEAWPEDIVEDIANIIRSPLAERHHLINCLITDLKAFEAERIDELVLLVSSVFNIKENKERLMLSWEEVGEMAENGIYFGSHTKFHSILTQVDESLVVEELSDSKSTIEHKLGRAAAFFSYPNGNYNETIMRYVKDAGYIAAFACLRGKTFSYEDRYEIKRDMVREDLASGFNGEYSDIFFKIELSGIRNRSKTGSFFRKFTG